MCGDSEHAPGEYEQPADGLNADNVRDLVIGQFTGDESVFIFAEGIKNYHGILQVFSRGLGSSKG